MNYVPITSTSPASYYWGIDQTVTYGSNGEEFLNSSGIVDMGPTLVLIATGSASPLSARSGADFKRLQTLSRSTRRSPGQLLTSTLPFYSSKFRPQIAEPPTFAIPHLPETPAFSRSRPPNSRTCSLSSSTSAASSTSSRQTRKSGPAS